VADVVPDPVDALLAAPENKSYAAMVERVRAFLRDYAELNRLIEGVESKERDLLFAISFTIDDINSTPPPLVKSLDQMLFGGWGPLIVIGSVLTILRSVALVHIRNNLKFNDGGVMTGGLSDRAAEIQGWIAQNEGRYENLKQRVKISANLTEMMGTRPSGLPSEYALVHGLGRFWW
jgi:hypothetical protein